jgi:hypothetical protein
LGAAWAIIHDVVNKRLAILLGVLAASRLFGADLAEKYAPLGRLIITNFASAPFPTLLAPKAISTRINSSPRGSLSGQPRRAVHPQRFSARKRDRLCRPFPRLAQQRVQCAGQVSIAGAIRRQRRNAILIVPQGPLDASDSFGGKLEDADGFKRFMAEALEVLRQQGSWPMAGSDRIILSGHSGGYEVISAILARGGLTGKISEVWLFDALYAKTERFALWFDHHPGRFIDLYTEHGGTKEESEALMTALAGNGVPYFSADETNATPPICGTIISFFFSANCRTTKWCKSARPSAISLKPASLRQQRRNSLVLPSAMRCPKKRDENQFAHRPCLGLSLSWPRFWLGPPFPKPNNDPYFAGLYLLRRPSPKGPYPAPWRPPGDLRRLHHRTKNVFPHHGNLPHRGACRS